MGKYRVLFLGTGSAFNVGCNNYHSNILIESKDGKRLLIDCGSDVRHSLFEQGYKYSDINAVYISHNHADHAGGLEWLALTNYFDPNCSKPKLLTADINVNRLWEKTLSGGLNTLSNNPLMLETFFQVEAINASSGFYWGKIHFDIVQVCHVPSGTTIMPCFGLFFTINETKIFFTSDTQFTPAILSKYYNEADVIFHDCENGKIISGVHSSYKDLKTLPLEVKKKMWLYHYHKEDQATAKSDGFLGFVKKGQNFNF